jgi:hypothetical protein
MSIHNLPIVGAFYRPPAKLILQAIAVGTPLLLSAEPDNEFDPHAVAVWIITENIAGPALELLELNIPTVGIDMETFVSQEQWHLGYVPKEWSVKLRLAGVVPENTVVYGKFMLENNKPHFAFDTPVL